MKHSYVRAMNVCRTTVIISISTVIGEVLFLMSLGCRFVSFTRSLKMGNMSDVGRKSDNIFFSAICIHIIHNFLTFGGI
jgi:hypothetical protein